MRVIPIEYGSAEYEEMLVLRRRFLREPLGLPLSDKDVLGEEGQHHFALQTEDGKTIGGLIGKPIADSGDDTVQIRQVVVHEDNRRTGCGTKLMAEAEGHLARLGFARFVLYAREESASFYERCGYQRTGESKELLGLLHVRMEKTNAAGGG